VDMYEILEELGLTKGEIKVYLALLEIGETTAGPVRKKTQMPNSAVHLCLNKLTDKGLVNYVQKGRIKFYTATKPENLLAFVEEKKRRLQDLLPMLLTKQKEKMTYEVKVYEGIKGLKAVHEDLLRELKRKDEFLVMSAPKRGHEKFEPYFLDFHQRRQKQGIKVRIIYKKEARAYAELRKKMKYTDLRFSPEKLTAPMWVTIYKNKTILFVVGDILFAIVIENKTIAENFKGYFELLWKISKV